MRSIFLTIVVGVTVFALAACGGTPAPAASLEDTAWTLTAYRKSRLIAGTSFTAAFADGQLRGSAGCNSYGGEYAIKGNTIEIGMLMSTMMACTEPDGLMEQEQFLLEFLQSVERWQMEDGQLQLFRADGEALTFVRQE